MFNQAQTNARAIGELVRLLSIRLGETGYGRFARAASVLLAAGFVVTVIALRVAEGPKAATTGLSTSAARWSLWLVGFVVAMAASRGRTLADRKDGLELSCYVLGLGGQILVFARAIAAFWLSLRFMLLPALLIGTVSLAASSGTDVAADRALVLVATLFFSIVVSAVLPPLGSVLESLAPKRGRSVLIAALLVSAAFAELTHDPAMSIVGLLDAALYAAMHLFGIARYA